MLSVTFKYVSRDVLDQMCNLYVRPHLDYGDIIYHKYDPDLKLDFTKKIRICPVLSRTWRKRAVAWHGVEQVDRSFILVGRISITGDSTVE